MGTNLRFFKIFVFFHAGLFRPIVGCMGVAHCRPDFASKVRPAEASSLRPSALASRPPALGKLLPVYPLCFFEEAPTQEAFEMEDKHQCKLHSFLIFRRKISWVDCYESLKRLSYFPGNCHCC